ncbi:NAD(P)-dependent alcohol dehydrogenase [Jiulongibacter sediminis]|uniref:Enoyl reductase (ER) domain-containing protein n=1 Tax=Jiulongibacter sediminis TaxID=1605367 RepID=A0A0P7BZJ6_9BACT|nr:NAD(P)-dependent alcohol dehydrogenase [Jiulongibacter sediminis]KPM47665.1 hypothetical protein AFM12_14425 [Jiulongibacter sediminis]TBX23457.1 hypothetical protein TK44_14435 [Jiulongibacter sediminis]
MKAFIYQKYGSPEVLELVNLEKPKPKENEILVRIKATTVTSGDVRLRSSDFPPVAWLIARLMFGLFYPKKKILGHELSGIVEAVGENVTRYQVGDAILATPTQLPSGAYAEYICIPEDRKKGVLAHKPQNLNFKEAAALPVGGMTALYLLKKAKLAKGQKVLVYGASGSVGSFAVQIAGAYEAEVTAVCSQSNSEMMKTLGAGTVLDYRREDYSTLGQQFDIVIDAVGKTSKSKASEVLKPGGQFVSVTSITKPEQEHLDELIELAEQGKIRPYIDKVFPFTNLTEAHTYVERGRKRGNVAIEIAKATVSP